MDRWETARRVGRRLRPWVDPSTRRPLVLLAVVAHRRLPRPVDGRRRAGRLLRPAPVVPPRARARGDPGPAGDRAPAALEGEADRRLAGPVRRRATARPPTAGCPGHCGWRRRRWPFPLLRYPRGTGFADWDFFLEKYEAARRSILDYGQFPWWDPWCRGGFPLAADPQVGVTSPAMPLVLWLGTTPGMAIVTVLCLLLAVEGSYRLARLWLGDAWAARGGGPDLRPQRRRHPQHRMGLLPADDLRDLPLGPLPLLPPPRPPRRRPGAGRLGGASGC